MWASASLCSLFALLCVFVAPTVALQQLIPGGESRPGGKGGDSTLAGSTKPSLHIVCFQKDESGILPEWVAYHEDLVGAQRLHVIDHNSTSPVVKRVLQLLAARGGQVIRYDGPFTRKSGRVTAVLKELAGQHPHAFLIPLDADEFLALSLNHRSTGFSTGRAVMRHIGQLPRDGFKLKLRYSAAARCGSSAARRLFAATHFSHPGLGCLGKVMYLGRSFVGSDQGNHFGRTTMDRACTPAQHTYVSKCKSCFHDSGLVTIHFGSANALSGPEYASKMLRGAIAYGFVKQRNASARPKSCVGRLGMHYCEWYRTLYGTARGQKPHRQQPAQCRSSAAHLGLVQALQMSPSYKAYSASLAQGQGLLSSKV